MKARLVDLAVGMDRKQRLTLCIDGDAREMWDELHEADVSVEIKRWRPRRSLDANAYAWVLIDKLAAALGLRKADIYREAIRQIGGVSTTVCVIERAVDDLVESWGKNGLGWFSEVGPSKIKGCRNVTLYYGSSRYDTRQMSQLIDVLVEEAKRQGIETMTPAEIEALNSAWGGRSA